MNLNTLKRSGLLLILAASTLAAQDGKKVPQKPDRAAGKAGSGMQIELTVTGMTSENQGAVQKALTDLTYAVFECSSCKVEQATAGECPGCEGELAAASKALLSEAKANGAKLTVAFDSGHPVRLTEISGALKAHSVQVDATQSPIGPQALLVFRGGMAADVEAIEGALNDAHLFENVKASFDEGTSEVRVAVRTGSSGATQAQVTSALASTGLDVELADVIWGMPKKGKMRG